MKPTSELYNNLMQTSYDHFNKTLFNNSLPDIMFTIQRINGVMGYFSANRWRSIKGVKCHELAINPHYMAQYSVIELMQTLVHEMVHCWQYCHGKPSQRNYHNKEWANKMESIGLMPSSTGRPGGKKVGQSMNDYPIPGGEFIKECRALIKQDSFTVNWIDANVRPSSLTTDKERISLLEQALSEENITSEELDELTEGLSTTIGSLYDDTDEEYPAKPINKNKTKYVCNNCEINMWGKSNLNILCMDCDIKLDEQ